jgi:TolA-binding protein
MTARRLAVLSLAGVAACATPSQVRRVETHVAMVEQEQARADSARAADLTRITAQQQQLMDSLLAGIRLVQQNVATMGRETSSQFTELRREMLALGEATNINTAKLNQFRSDIESAMAAPPPAAAPAQADTNRSATPATDTSGARMPSDDQLYSTGRKALDMGAVNAAQSAFQQLIQSYPTSPLMPNALLSLANTFDPATPDSASFYYTQVVNNFSDSQQAPTALYKLAGIALRRTPPDVGAAKAYYQQIIDRYKTSPEYELAVENLKKLP